MHLMRVLFTDVQKIVLFIVDQCFSRPASQNQLKADLLGIYSEHKCIGLTLSLINPSH